MDVKKSFTVTIVGAGEVSIALRGNDPSIPAVQRFEISASSSDSVADAKAKLKAFVDSVHVSGNAG